MKKILVSVLSLLLALCLCSCSKGGAEVSLYDLKNAMAGAATDFGEMKYASSEDEGAESIFQNISELDYGKVGGFFVYYAADGTGNADELVAVEVKNKNDIALAKAALEAHLQQRRALYATYDKTQLHKLDAGRVETCGNVAVLIVADDAAAISNAFYGYFKQ